MSYMNIREFCAFDFCMDIFRMSYMNLRELCLCLFCTYVFCMSYMYPREYIKCLFCMCFKLNFVCPTWTQKECGRKQLKLHGHVTGNNKSYRGCKELGTIIGPGEDKNRNMTSMSETRIKLSCNGPVKVFIVLDDLWLLPFFCNLICANNLAKGLLHSAFNI